MEKILTQISENIIEKTTSDLNSRLPLDVIHFSFLGKKRLTYQYQLQSVYDNSTEVISDLELSKKLNCSRFGSILQNSIQSLYGDKLYLYVHTNSKYHQLQNRIHFINISIYW